MTISERLKVLLASTYSLASQAHLAHWNVTGPRFPSLHKLFGNQYDELYEASDAIAEYIRSRNPAEFSPGGLTALSKLSTVKEMKSGEKVSAEGFIAGLATGQQAVIDICKELIKDCEKADDQVTLNFAATRQEAHLKMRWMLVSSI